MGLCGSAPSPDPLIGQAAQMNADTAKEALAWYKDLYNKDLLPMQKEQAELGKKLANRYLTSMDEQEQFAKEQKEYYKTTFKPIEEQMAKDAMGYDSQANIERRAGIATANVEQQFSNAAAENNRNLSRYGVNPNSSAFAATNERLMRDAALAKAGAGTGAAFDTEDRAIALRAGASNFGRNMPNTSAQFTAGSNAAGGAALGAGGAGISAYTNGASVMGQGYGNFYQGNTSAGNLALGNYSAQMQGYAADQAAIGGLMQGIGTAAGAYFGKPPGRADGGAIHRGHGKVSGPGGPVDDKVPAMLSDGEYVIPADVVKAKGVEFFDKLKAKYHTPAAVQRRQAIQRG